MDEKTTKALNYFINRLNKIEESISLIDHKIDQLLDTNKPISKEDDDMKCPKCSAPLHPKIIKGPYGDFMGCSKWRETECKGKKSLK